MTSLAHEPETPPAPHPSQPRSRHGPSCANCESFLGRAELATLDGEPGPSGPSEDGVCLVRLARAEASGLCAAWSAEPGANSDFGPFILNQLA